MKHPTGLPERKRLIWREILLLVVLIFALSTLSPSFAVPPVYAAPAHIKVEVSDHTLTAGVNNTITIRLTSIDLDIRELRATLDFSLTPLVLLGDNHWKFTYLDEGESVEFDVVIYAPESAIGFTCSATLELTFGTPGLQPSEIHTINFIVYGWIDMVIYDVEVDPNPVAAGSPVTISANILNRGNVAAMYTNVSIVPSDTLVLTGESIAYIGQVDPNAPVPFFVSAIVRSDVDEGVYPVVIQVVYQDDRKIFHSITRTVQIQVTHVEEKTQPKPSQRFQLWLIRKGWVYLTALICVATAASALYLRRRRTRGKGEIEKLLALKRHSPGATGVHVDEHYRPSHPIV